MCLYKWVIFLNIKSEVETKFTLRKKKYHDKILDSVRNKI